MSPSESVSSSKLVGLIVGAVAIIACMFAGCGSFTTIGAGTIAVKQNVLDGQLSVWSSPGVHARNFGNVTEYKISDQFWFSEREDEGKKTDDSILVQFNDGGQAHISGSLRFDLPTDPNLMIELHKKFGSEAAIEHQLIRQVVNKSVFMAAQNMTSRESYSDKRADLLRLIIDQIDHGCYRTMARDVKIVDALSGQEKTVTVHEPVLDPKSPNGIAREEVSPLDTFGIKAYNLTINSITYSDIVNNQIQAQQVAQGAVTTAQAKAREAEQNAITIAKEGEATAAKAKWTQEAEKATVVTKAQQEVEVAKLELEAAQLTKQKDIALGEGESQRRKLLMSADGALDARLDALKEINAHYADAIAKQPIVPQFQMGSGPGSSSFDLANMLMLQTAKSIGLDMTPGTKSGK